MNHRPRTTNERRKVTGRQRPEVRTVKLACGHQVDASEPVAVFPGRRELYACPEGCGLRKAA